MLLIFDILSGNLKMYGKVAIENTDPETPKLPGSDS